MSEAIGLIEDAGFNESGKYCPLRFHIERCREGLFVLGRDDQDDKRSWPYVSFFVDGHGIVTTAKRDVEVQIEKLVDAIEKSGFKRWKRDAEMASSAS
ncbi:hypothetical protein [Bradyrhizobium sp. Rc2d]|uniref:hypothetical protein n=1 Tax=Bradyrhizobium sp. Rc2d TaxID=1855321 RepID=UPI000B880668|nr:hypothetical protein [Bradyrhizobium sp. Rc2d]